NFLTKFADKVTLVHRRKELRASKIMQDRAFANPKIEFRWNSRVTGVKGSGRVEALELRDVETGADSELAVTGLFVAIGHDPNTKLFAGQLDLDAQRRRQPERRAAIRGHEHPDTLGHRGRRGEEASRGRQGQAAAARGARRVHRLTGPVVLRRGDRGNAVRDLSTRLGLRLRS